MTLLIVFIVAELLLFIDMLQTRYISKNPDRFFEINPILGKHPSITAVNLYFLAWFIGVGVLFYFGYLIPIALVIIMQMIVTVRNYKIGIRFA